jgi:hypothetical protein
MTSRPEFRASREPTVAQSRSAEARRPSRRHGRPDVRQLADLPDADDDHVVGGERELVWSYDAGTRQQDRAGRVAVAAVQVLAPYAFAGPPERSGLALLSGVRSASRTRGP